MLVPKEGDRPPEHVIEKTVSLYIYNVCANCCFRNTKKYPKRQLHLTPVASVTVNIEKEHGVIIS